MAKISIKTKNFQKFAKALDSNVFKKKLIVNSTAALHLVAERVQQTSRDMIDRNQVTPKDAALTVLIKGESLPTLKETGEFQRSIKIKQMQYVDKIQYFIGITSDNPNYQIYYGLLNGKSITVTDKMRTMFFYLHLASIGKVDPGKLKGRAAVLWSKHKGFWPSLARKRVIRLPKRILFSKALRSKDIRPYMTHMLKAAIAQTFNDIIKGG